MSFEACNRTPTFRVTIVNCRELQPLPNDAHLASCCPCEFGLPWEEEARAGQKHFLYLCEEHAREKDLVR